MSDPTPTPSRITEVRRAIAGLLAGTPGITEISPYPLDEVHGEGVAWLGWDTETITPGPNEIGRHEIELFYVVNRNGRISSELAETEPVIAAIKTRIRGNQGLYGLSDHFYFTQVRQTVIENNSVEYIGFVMVLNIKTRETVSSQIAI